LLPVLATRSGKSGTGLTSLTTSVRPFATTPLSFVAFPSSISLAPTMLSKGGAKGDLIAGSKIRSSARTKSRAVTRAPFE
jgi:hypothetical protein